MNSPQHDINALHDEGSSSTSSSQPPSKQLIDTTNEPMKNYDGSLMRDTNSQIVYKSQFLSTHPLLSDCKERVGYGGKKFTYVSGDGVIRDMNTIFGYGTSFLSALFGLACSHCPLITFCWPAMSCYLIHICMMLYALITLMVWYSNNDTVSQEDGVPKSLTKN